MSSSAWPLILGMTLQATCAVLPGATASYLCNPAWYHCKPPLFSCLLPLQATHANTPQGPQSRLACRLWPPHTHIQTPIRDQTCIEAGLLLHSSPPLSMQPGVTWSVSVPAFVRFPDHAAPLCGLARPSCSCAHTHKHAHRHCMQTQTRASLHSLGTGCTASQRLITMKAGTMVGAGIQALTRAAGEYVLPRVCQSPTALLGHPECPLQSARHAMRGVKCRRVRQGIGSP